jgi:NitT/TauT family transport system substrate-binding protein
MGRDHSQHWARRDFLGGVALAGSAALMGLTPEPASAEPSLETTAIRLPKPPSLCSAPQFLASEFLRGEGFSDVRYIKMTAKEIAPALVSGAADMSMHFGAVLARGLDAGDSFVILAGVHAGCFELFGTARVHNIHDLKGKSIAVPELGVGPHLILSAMVAYVGIDPNTAVNWVIRPAVECKKLLAEGKVDAYMGFPPDPQELRERRIGHVIVNSAVDRPWSQYYCCLVAANRSFVRRRPVATKRALRAILKAADFCAREPDRAAQLLVNKGYTARYDYALDMLKMLPYGKWREYDPEDSLRFWALRLREAGMIKTSPNKIIAQSTDWRFLNELKKELKG